MFFYSSTSFISLYWIQQYLFYWNICWLEKNKDSKFWNNIFQKEKHSFFFKSFFLLTSKFHHHSVEDFYLTTVISIWRTLKNIQFSEFNSYGNSNLSSLIWYQDENYDWCRSLKNTVLKVHLEKTPFEDGIFSNGELIWL